MTEHKRPASELERLLQRRHCGVARIQDFAGFDTTDGALVHASVLSQFFLRQLLRGSRSLEIELLHGYE